MTPQADKVTDPGEMDGRDRQTDQIEQILKVVVIGWWLDGLARLWELKHLAFYSSCQCHVIL